MKQAQAPDGAAMNSYIEGSPREISQNGETLYMVDQVIPDVTMTPDTSLSLYMNTRKFPNATEITKGPFTITSSTEKVSTRAKGRQISMKFQSTGNTMMIGRWATSGLTQDQMDYDNVTGRSTFCIKASNATKRL